MTRVEGENTRLKHYLAQLHRKTLCYAKPVEMLNYSVRLLLHYLKFWDVPIIARNIRDLDLPGTDPHHDQAIGVSFYHPHFFKHPLREAIRKRLGK